MAPTAVRILESGQLVSRLGGHETAGRHDRQNRERLAERGAVAVGARGGVVDGRESGHEIAPGKARRIAPGGDHGQDRLAGLSGIANRPVGGAGEIAQGAGRT